MFLLRASASVGTIVRMQSSVTCAYLKLGRIESFMLPASWNGHTDQPRTATL